MAELATLAKENFEIKKVLIKPRKADHESEGSKRVLNGKYSSAKAGASFQLFLVDKFFYLFFNAFGLLKN